MLIEVHLMGTWIKHCSLMMSLARPFEIQNGADFSLSLSKDMSYPKIRYKYMARPCILVLANVEGFALCKDNLYPFCSHYAVLEVAVEFSISIFFFWFKQFERNSNGDLVISQLPLGDVLSKP